MLNQGQRGQGWVMFDETCKKYNTSYRHAIACDSHMDRKRKGLMSKYMI